MYLCPSCFHGKTFREVADGRSLLLLEFTQKALIISSFYEVMNDRDKLCEIPQGHVGFSNCPNTSDTNYLGKNRCMKKNMKKTKHLHTKYVVIQDLINHVRYYNKRIK